MKIYELDTPALVIDLDRVEANLRRWQSFCDRHGVKNRPHIKTHKIPELARMQIDFGAVGITCQKLGEAEAMAEGGLEDIFLAYNVVGEAKLERLLALHQRLDICTTADGRDVVKGLETMASKAGKPLSVRVECDTGMHRIGVHSPEAAADLAGFIDSRDGLKFGGFCTYPAGDEALVFMEEAKRLCATQGLEDFEISGGGTPPMWNLPKFPCFTEYRAGTYIYYDRITLAVGAARQEDIASSLLVSVVSTAGESWVTVDGGTKTFSSDQYGQTGFGVLWDDPNGLLVRCSEEHGVFQLNGGKPDIALGAKLRIIPNHACLVSNLHDTAFAVRGEDVVAEWKISARGKVQ